MKQRVVWVVEALPLDRDWTPTLCLVTAHKWQVRAFESRRDAIEQRDEWKGTGTTKYRVAKYTRAARPVGERAK